MVPGVDVVYPLHGGSAIEGESKSGYPTGETPINRPSERHPESDCGGHSGSTSWEGPREESTGIDRLELNW